jgi:hypothetical protein
MMKKSVTEVLTTTYYNTWLQQREVKTFKCLEDIDSLIDEYQKRSQNKVRIKKSLPDSFCFYFCLEHAKVSVPVFCGGKRTDGLFAVKRIASKHTGRRTMISSVASMPPKSSRNESDDDKIKDKVDTNADQSFHTDGSNADDDDDGTGTVAELFEELLREGNVDAFAFLEDIGQEITYAFLAWSLIMHIDRIVLARNMLTAHFEFC